MGGCIKVVVNAGLTTIVKGRSGIVIDTLAHSDPTIFTPLLYADKNYAQRQPIEARRRETGEKSPDRFAVHVPINPVRLYGRWVNA